MARNIFTEHPNSIGETYWEHLVAAACIGGRLIKASFFCFVHAVFPFLFEKNGSQEIRSLHELIAASRTVPADDSSAEPEEA